MPTWDKTARFNRDYATLSKENQAEFMAAVSDFVADLKAGDGFRNGLRVKGVRGRPGVFEMSWAGDGRATFRYGDSVREGEAHIIWLQVGTHDIL